MSDRKILQAILDKISVLEQGQKNILSKFDKLEHRLTKRIDVLGQQLNEIDEDAPTTEEFQNHEKRITRLEKQANLI